MKMNFDISSPYISFINPSDLRGGASLGTYRLFILFQRFSPFKVCLRVAEKKSANNNDIIGLPIVFTLLYYCQSVFNKLLSNVASFGYRLPVNFTFLSVFSLPALLLFCTSYRSKYTYLHSMNGGFTCPISFALLISKASIIKTADDWYLTGGCHYSLECQQWRSGCKSCPHMNPLGKLLVRFNWLLKSFILRFFSGTFVSPSSWLYRRYKSIYPSKSKLVYNSVSLPYKICKPKHLSSSLAQNNKFFSFGLSVPNICDHRKGHLESISFLLSALSIYPIKIYLCGRHAGLFRDKLYSQSSSICAGSEIITLGPIDPNEMKNFYDRIDFLLNFSLFDNSPNIITESLSHNVPVIVMNSAGSPEHVEASGAGFLMNTYNDLLDIMRLIHAPGFSLYDYRIKAYRYATSELSGKIMFQKYSSIFSSHQ